jgi:Lanthionine-containing peptide SapB precursor RamS
MALLDLQGLETPPEHRPSGSRASRGCGGNSSLSLLLC